VPFRFIHTADIHLDSPLRSLALRDPALAELIGSASRTAFRRTIDLCLTEKVEALVIAGDLYDGDQTSMKTARFLAAELARLDAAGIRCFIIRGNHDALSKITRELVMPPSVTLFGDKASTVLWERPGRAVALHGISFAKPQAPDSLLDRFPAPVAGALNIGLMHTSLAGAPGHDRYAPCALSDLQDSGYDYWALGHVHIRALYPAPGPGKATVLMPGIPQGRDIGEAGAKSVSLVTLYDDGRAEVAEHVVAPARFERLDIDARDAGDWRALHPLLAQSLRDARRNLPAEQLVIRPMIRTGAALHALLQRDGDLLLAEAMTVAEEIGSLWIDKVELLAPLGTPAAPAPGAIADLAALIATEILTDPGVLHRAEAAMEELHRALPPELRRSADPDPAARAARQAALMQAGAEEVLAHLQGTATRTEEI
jgi:DNA repair protein SbcD/Mre11